MPTAPRTTATASRRRAAFLLATCSALALCTAPAHADTAAPAPDAPAPLTTLALDTPLSPEEQAAADRLVPALRAERERGISALADPYWAEPHCARALLAHVASSDPELVIAALGRLSTCWNDTPEINRAYFAHSTRPTLKARPYDAEVVALLEARLRRHNLDVQAAALQATSAALKHKAHPRLLRALYDLLHPATSPTALRVLTAEALPASKLPEVVALQTLAFQDPDPAVQLRALYSAIRLPGRPWLRTLPQPQAHLDLLATLQDHPDDAVAHLATYSRAMNLMVADRQDAYNTVVCDAARSPRAHVRAAALAALAWPPRVNVSGTHTLPCLGAIYDAFAQGTEVVQITLPSYADHDAVTFPLCYIPSTGQDCGFLALQMLSITEYVAPAFHATYAPDSPCEDILPSEPGRSVCIQAMQRWWTTKIKPKLPTPPP